MNENLVVTIAIVVLGAVSIVAITTGRDGVLVTALASAIGGLVGSRVALRTISPKK